MEEVRVAVSVRVRLTGVLETEAEVEGLASEERDGEIEASEDREGEAVGSEERAGEGVTSDEREGEAVESADREGDSDGEMVGLAVTEAAPEELGEGVSALLAEGDTVGVRETSVGVTDTEGEVVACVEADVEAVGEGVAITELLALLVGVPESEGPGLGEAVEEAL
jgi:hypothetical protein